MRTIGIPRTVKKMLDDEFEVSSNKAIKEMIRTYEHDKVEAVEGDINIGIDDETLNSLAHLRIYENETYASVILRLLAQYKLKNK